MSWAEGFTAALSRKRGSTTRSWRIVDRSREGCLALSRWSTRVGQCRSFRPPGCFQNPVRFAKSFRRTDATRRPGAFPVHNFGVAAKPRGRAAGRCGADDPLQTADQSRRRRSAAAAFTKKSGRNFRRHSLHEQQRRRIASSSGGPGYSFAFSEHCRTAELRFTNQWRKGSIRLRRTTA